MFPVIIVALLGLGGIACLYFAVRYWLEYHHELILFSHLARSTGTLSMEQIPHKITELAILGFAMLVLPGVVYWQLRRK